MQLFFETVSPTFNWTKFIGISQVVVSSWGKPLLISVRGEEGFTKINEELLKSNIHGREAKLGINFSKRLSFTVIIRQDNTKSLALQLFEYKILKTVRRYTIQIFTPWRKIIYRLYKTRQIWAIITVLAKNPMERRQKIGSVCFSKTQTNYCRENPRIQLQI